MTQNKIAVAFTALLSLTLICTASSLSFDDVAKETIQKLIDEGHISGTNIGDYTAAQLGRDISTPDERLPSSMSLSPGGVSRQIRTNDAIFGSFALTYTTPPDLTVSIDPAGTTCNRVSFTVNLVPSQGVSPSGNQPVRVRVIDNVFGTAGAVAEALVLIPASGGSLPLSLGFPMPEDAYAGTGWSNEITVIVDPDNEVQETNETNNQISASGTC